MAEVKTQELAERGADNGKPLLLIGEGFWAFFVDLFLSGLRKFWQELQQRQNPAILTDELIINKQTKRFFQTNLLIY